MSDMRGRLVGSGKDAETIGIEALGFLAGDQELMRRFLDLTGIEGPNVRELAARPSFFVGLLDFMLAHEPTLEAFAQSARIEPWEVGVARERLDRGPSG